MLKICSEVRGEAHELAGQRTERDTPVTVGCCPGQARANRIVRVDVVGFPSG